MSVVIKQTKILIMLMTKIVIIVIIEELVSLTKVAVIMMTDRQNSMEKKNKLKYKLRNWSGKLLLKEKSFKK